LIHFMTILYILRLFGIFFPVLVNRSNKNLATLVGWKGLGNKWCTYEKRPFGQVKRASDKFSVFHANQFLSRVARWYSQFRSKNLLHLGIFGRALKRKFWCVSWPFGTFKGHLGHFMASW
jgi:hypothetical protein